MTADERRTASDREDHRKEEHRERYRELLEELRTIIPGVQVLFAFLLTVPFSARFTEVDAAGRDLFTAALLGTALATVFFVTPAALHRLSPGADREKRLHTSERLAIIGLAVLGVSVTLAVLVVTRFIYQETTLGLLVAAVVLGAAVAMWFAFPLAERARRDSS